MMEDATIYDSNVAYNICRGGVQQQHFNLTAQTEAKSEPMYMSLTTSDQHSSNNEIHSTTSNDQTLREAKDDDLKVLLIKMKKLLIAMILFVAVLVVTTLTAIIFSVMSYRLSQTNGESQVRLAAVDEDKISVLQKNLASLQTQLYCGAGEWHPIAFLNMTDPSQQCPPAWREYNTSGIRACGRASSNEGSCSSVAYMAEYTKEFVDKLSVIK